MENSYDEFIGYFVIINHCSILFNYSISMENENVWGNKR